MDDQNNSNPFMSIHTPVALLAIALSMLFFSQLSGASQTKDNMTWQSKNAKTQMDILTQNQTTLTDILKKQADNAPQTKQIQDQLAEFMKELVTLASGDKPDKDALDVVNVAVQLGLRVNMAAEQPKKDEAKKDEKK